MLSANTHSGVYLQFRKQSNGFRQEIRACSTSINGHPIVHLQQRVQCLLYRGYKSFQVSLLDSLLGRLDNVVVSLMNKQIVNVFKCNMLIKDEHILFKRSCKLLQYDGRCCD